MGYYFNYRKSVLRSSNEARLAARVVNSFENFQFNFFFFWKWYSRIGALKKMVLISKWLFFFFLQNENKWLDVGLSSFRSSWWKMEKIRKKKIKSLLSKNIENFWVNSKFQIQYFRIPTFRVKDIKYKNCNIETTLYRCHSKWFLCIFHLPSVLRNIFNFFFLSFSCNLSLRGSGFSV